MEIVDETMDILIITENGMGKRTPSKEYKRQGRGGLGILAMKLTEKSGKIRAVKSIEKKEDIVVITDRGQVIRTNASGISLLGRATQGVRIIKLKKGEKVVAVEKIAKEE